jgi:prevent-host-death family protein
VSIYELKQHLSTCISHAAEGAECTIPKLGRPIARLVPVAPTDVSEPLEAGEIDFRPLLPGRRLEQLLELSEGERASEDR